MLKTIFEKLKEAWGVEFKAISVKKAEENEITIEFGERLSFPNFRSYQGIRNPKRAGLMISCFFAREMQGG